MAKVVAPLFGFDAYGTIAKTVTMAKWRGVAYAKRYTIPSNPQTTGQQETRNIFAALNQFYKLAPSGLIAPWTAYAKGRPFTNRNAFIGQNTKAMRAIPAKTTMEDFIGSPGAGGGPPPSSMVLTPGDDQISAALTLPEVPTGWTLTSSWAFAFVDQNPNAAFNQEIFSNEEAGTPQTNLLTGLPDASDMIVTAFLEWEKPDGTIAYSVSLTDTATTT